MNIFISGMVRISVPPALFILHTEPRLLWFTEGVTSYYQDIVMLRAGLISPERYIDVLGDRIALYKNRPGRLLASAEEASFLTWIKHYRPDHNTENTVPNYYVIGALLGLSLNLEIIRISKGAHSLDDLMRLLLLKYENTGVPEEGIRKTVEEMTGSSFQDFFVENVESPGEIDLDRYLGIAGYILQPETSSLDDGKSSNCRDGMVSKGFGGRLGIRTSDTTGSVRVKNIFAGGAADNSSLCPGDEIVAIDGFRVAPSGLETILDRYVAGNTVELTVFRQDVLYRIPIELGENQIKKFTIKDLQPAPTSQQVCFRKKWFFGF